MRTFAAGVLERGPRRSQLGKVARPDRRGELAAGLAVIALVTELLVVPAAVAVSLALLAVARVLRWRPDWLLALGPSTGTAMLLIGAGGTRPGCQAVPIMILDRAARAGLALARPRRARRVRADVPTAAGSR